MFLIAGILTNCLGFVPLILLQFTKRRHSRDVFFIEPFLWLLALASLYEFVGTLLLRIGSDYWFYIYSLSELLCIFYFFFRLLNGKLKYLFYIVTPLITCLWLGLLFYWDTESNLKTDSIMSCVEVIFINFFAMYWFREIFASLRVESLWQSPQFYYVCGFILYFSGTFFLFLSSDYLFRDQAIVFEEFWLLNILLSFILRTLFIIGSWKALKT